MRADPGSTYLQLKIGSANPALPLPTATRSQQSFPAGQKNTKFLVKLVRDTRAAGYVQWIDRSPIETTVKRNLVLAMGRLTEDVVRSLANSRRTPELVPVQVSE